MLRPALVLVSFLLLAAPLASAAPPCALAGSDVAVESPAGSFYVARDWSVWQESNGAPGHQRGEETLVFEPRSLPLPPGSVTNANRLAIQVLSSVTGEPALAPVCAATSGL